MQDVYDFFFDVNSHLIARGLERLDDTLRPAIMSGVLSDMLTASLAKHSRVLTENNYFNGHPDLVVQGLYPNNAVKAGDQGVEIKTTRKKGGAVDTHGARDQWMWVFVYTVDHDTEPAIDRAPMTFTEIYLAQVTTEDFRRKPARRTGHTNRDAAPPRRRQAAGELAVPRVSYPVSATGSCAKAGIASVAMRK